MFPDRGDAFFVTAFCAFILVAITCKNALSLLSSYLQGRLGRNSGRNIRLMLFQRMLGASQHIFDEKKSGELTQVYTVETLRAQQSVEFTLFFGQRLFLALLYICFVLWLSWQLTLGLLVLVVLIGSFTTLFHSKLRTQGDERSEAYRTLYSALGQILNGIRIIRASHAEGAMHEEFRTLNTKAAEVDRKGSFLAGSIAPLSEVLAVAGAMILLSVSYVLLIQKGTLSSTSIMVFGVVLIRMLPLLNQLYGVIAQLNYSSAGVREILRWIDVPQFPDRPFGKRTFRSIQQSIRFEHVSFTYPNGTVALDDISFEIPSGKTVAMVGASGSGKSTLASLLLRVRTPTEGRILVDDINYWEFTPESWHGSLGMVEQEAFLFNETIEKNILFGLKNVSRERLDKAIEIAHLREVIESLPAGLQTVVGERGTMLSGGQKQRLAIARAIVRDPQLLILDEATSALDNYSERLVQSALEEARQGRTSMVIAHRLSTIRSADSIVVLEQGKVVQMGSWSELESVPGTFRRLLNAAKAGHLDESMSS
jgi:subfamily B ATP-binding cassette protein MsbA